MKSWFFENIWSEDAPPSFLLPSNMIWMRDSRRPASSELRPKKYFSKKIKKKVGDFFSRRKKKSPFSFPVCRHGDTAFSMNNQPNALKFELVF